MGYALLIFPTRRGRPSEAMSGESTLAHPGVTWTIVCLPIRVRETVCAVSRSVWASGTSLLLAAVVLVGCGGHDEPVGFTGADARRLAEVAPVTPGWPAWPDRAEKKQRPRRSLEETLASDPIFAEYHRRTSQLGGDLDARDSGNRWEDENKLANLTVGTFVSVADAHVAFDASNDLALGYGKQYGAVTKAEQVKGLADEAWVLWATGNGSQVTYHWRRANLVGEVHIHCFGNCPSDVDAATRAWAEAIDEESLTGI